MKVSANWLAEWIEGDWPRDDLSELLTAAGLEVGCVDEHALPGVVVGCVTELRSHPNADRLQICAVDVGAGELVQIVTGAPNVSLNHRYPCVLAGATLPGGMRIRKSKLRGEVSEGMLCSGPEIGLDDPQAEDGLMRLPDDAPIGELVASYLKLDDTVLDLEITPNRGDCNSILGVARELAALSALSALKPPHIEPVQPQQTEVMNVSIDAPAECPRYCSRVLQGLSPHSETPHWMRQKIESAGLRCVYLAVDVTNYILLEWGQPLHAFDATKIKGQIYVRKAHSGEQLQLLDGQTVKLRAGDLLIADDEGPIALAGVMGGMRTAISESSTDIVLESAFFSPSALAGCARHYGLNSDAAYRFERGVDWQLQRTAMERATHLLQEHGGATCGPIVEVEHSDDLPAAHLVVLRKSRLNQLLGVELASDLVVRLLEAVGLNPKTLEQDVWEIQAPSHRFDIQYEEDLVEEVARLYGYDNLPARIPRGVPDADELSLSRKHATHQSQWRGVLCSRGYQEVVTNSMIASQLAQTYSESDSVKLFNPISSEMEVMRPSLLPSLGQVVLYNRARGVERIKIYEMAKVFLPRKQGDPNGLPEQPQRLGLIIAGTRSRRNWADDASLFDFYDLKGDLQSLLPAGASLDLQESAHTGFEMAATVVLEGEPIGVIGKLHETLAGESAYGLEIAWDWQLQAQEASTKIPQVQRYPMVRKDLALVLPNSVTVKQVLECIRKVAGKLLYDVQVFDRYTNNEFEQQQQYSLGVGLVLCDQNKTLTTADIESCLKPVVKALQRNCQASLRS